MVHIKRSLMVQLSTVVFSALGGALLFSSSTVALSNVSPNPEDMVAIDDGGREVRGGLSHLLKNETVAQVRALKLGAYFTEDRRSSHTFQITHGIDGMKCLLAARLERTARNPSFISVTIGEGSTKEVYKIPFRKNKVCNDTNTNYRNIPEGDNGNKSLNRLFGKYNIPANTLIPDPATGHDFYVPITIAYAQDDPDTPRVREPEVEQGGSDENSVNFRAVLDGPYRPNSIHKIGPLGGPTRDRTFGLRSAFFKPSDPDYGNRGVRARVQFGVPCDEGTTSGLVSLYDADTDRFGRTYLKVTKGTRNNPNGTPLRQNDYNTDYNRVRRNGRITYVYRPPNENIEWQRISVGFRSTATEGGGNRNSIIKLATIEPGVPNNRFTYRYVIDNPADTNPNNIPPNANTLNVAIPFDSIYGDISSCEYELKPDRPSTSRTYTENQTLQVTSSVGRAPDSGDGATGRHEWQTFVARYNSVPNENIAREYRTGNSNADACRAVPSRDRRSCDPLFRFDQPVYPEEESRTVSYLTNAGEGNIICFFTRIQKPINTSPSDMWRYSDMFCSILGKQPKVQIWGHDLRVGEDIDTSVTSIEGKTYYNWGEYAVMSNGCNIDGSATSGADGYKGSSSPQNLLHPLTFSNTTTRSPDGSTDCKGNYGGDIITPFDRYIQGGTITRGNGTNTVNLNRVLNGGGGGQNAHTFSAGTKRIFYYPNATVRIRANLNYGNSYNSISQIPRVIIVAKNIVVDSDVTRVDPWLIALENGGGGRIATCDEAVGMTASVIESGAFPAMDTSGLLNRDRCDEQIKFNSPVMASEIYLYRTHGSTGSAPAKAAEVFNLRADSFLSTYAGGSGVDAVATTDAVIELPPRF